MLISIGYRNTCLSTCYHTLSSAGDHMTGNLVLLPKPSVYWFPWLLSPLLPSLDVPFSLSFSSTLFLCLLSSPASLVWALCQHQEGSPMSSGKVRLSALLSPAPGQRVGRATVPSSHSNHRWIEDFPCSKANNQALTHSHCTPDKLLLFLDSSFV